MRDKKKFYVPKHIKNPQPGDYEVTLNWGDKVYVEKNEFEKKTSKFFKNYQVIGDNQENNHDYSQDYFTIISAANITPHIRCNAAEGILFAYSVNNGEWIPFSAGSIGSGVSVTIELPLSSYDNSNGLKIRCKGYSRHGSANAPVYVPPLHSLQFGFDTPVSVEGNILSLMFSDDFNLINSEQDVIDYIPPVNLPVPGIGVSQLFKNTQNLIDASNLIFPNFGKINYNSMFENCTSLQKSPVLYILPARNMFDGCSALSHITCLWISQNQIDTYYSWVKNVAATGTFVKATGANWSTGTTGIPEGWTVIEV